MLENITKGEPLEDTRTSLNKNNAIINEWMILTITKTTSLGHYFQIQLIPSLR